MKRVIIHDDRYNSNPAKKIKLTQYSALDDANVNIKKYNNVEYDIKNQELESDNIKIIKSFNHIYFNSSITQSSAANLISILSIIEHENIEMIHKNKLDELRPIYIHIFSEGGNLFAALAIYKNIKLLSSPVHCHVNGPLSGAAIIILLGCDNRYMSTTAVLCIQSIKILIWRELRFAQHCDNTYENTYANILDSLEYLYETHTKLKQHNINIKQFICEYQLIDAQTALKYGFITEILD